VVDTAPRRGWLTGLWDRIHAVVAACCRTADLWGPGTSRTAEMISACAVEGDQSE
jgi:hypothetical protein